MSSLVTRLSSAGLRVSVLNMTSKRRFARDSFKEKEEGAEAVDVHKKEKEQLEKLAARLRQGENISQEEKNKLADNIDKSLNGKK